MTYNFFDQKTGLTAIVNEDPAEKLHKREIKNFKR